MISTYLLKRFALKSRIRSVDNMDGDGTQKPETISFVNTILPRRSKRKKAVKDTTFKCRICLQTADIPIFADDQDQATELADKIKTIISIELEKNDGLPQHLCSTCNQLLQGAILLRETAEQTDQILRSKRTNYNTFDDTEFQDYEPASDDDQDYEKETSKKTSKHKKTKKYHCKVCFLDFKWLEEYYDHTRTVEHIKQRRNPKIQCKICDKTLRRHYYKQHLKLHKTQKLYKIKCRTCQQYYKKGEYKEHLATHEPNSEIYICEVCGRSFNRRNVYKCHLETHSDNFPFSCSFCPYKGRNKGLLKIHIRTHTGDYRYQCSECPARFLTSSNLNRHMSKHKGRRYECHSCKRKFYAKYELEQHYKVDHMGIKDFICNICDKAFGYRHAMRKHQLHVHKREKFVDGKGRMPAYLEYEKKKQQGIL